MPAARSIFGELRFTENALGPYFIAISDAKPLHTFAEIAPAHFPFALARVVRSQFLHSRIFFTQTGIRVA
jgi:hypothetical protein